MKTLVYSKNLNAGGSERSLLEIVKGLNGLGEPAQLILGREKGDLLPQAHPSWLTSVPAARFPIHERLLKRAGILDKFYPDRLFDRCLDYLKSKLSTSAFEAIHEPLRRMLHPDALLRLKTALETHTPETLVSSLVETGHLVALMALHVSRGRRPRWVAIEQNNTALRLKDHYESAKIREAWREVTTLVYSNCDVVVAISEGVRDGLIEHFGIPASKITVIHNPIPCSEIAESIPAAQDKPFILTAGRLHSQKRQDHLLRAFAKISDRTDAELWLAGSGPLLDHLQNLAAELNISSQTRFLGVRTDLWSLMKSANLFVLCSKYEGLGMVLAEAMAAGCPVVSYDCDYGPREIIKDRQNGRLVQDGDIDGLAEAILDTLATKKATQTMQKRALLEVQRFDSSAVAAKYQKLFDRND